ncbi:DUF1990 domain-containing protein [Streptomyces sp. NBC_01218]|uniref:DUF1990 family protein n=1 Tax=unclassified Streptomyces TaxID=2593676 RepID=UPI0023B9ACA2|nr:MULTISPECIES: DUF1990 domain-containing protein [unclassified Streptomyces]WEH43542.1 DUF1990 domain-containing protein [Streptomyces sp. AM 2-1-1]WSQ55185.1 DUF1990 domain-containing protein [Streptomyces sp. NBC_01218]
MHGLTYSEVGGTRSDPLPRGYRHLRHRTPVGRGRAAFEAAGAAVTTWRMHREAGTLLGASAARAEEGVTVRVTLRVGPLRFVGPCEVVWAEYTDERIGFAYGSLDGHPERGEESFVVELADDGTVWFAVTAFSRPGLWYTRLAGPVVPVFQRMYAQRLGRTVRRIVAG